MTFINWFIDVVKNKYVKFDGRAGRPEYWFFILGCFVVYFILGIIDGLLFGYPILLSIFALAMILPSLAACIRRLHDTDRSGWFVLVSLIPFVGGIILFVFLVLPGTPGDNRFGPPGPTSPNA